MTALAAVALALSITAGPVHDSHPDLGTTLGPVHCHPVRCYQRATSVRPFLGGFMTTVSVHSRPTNTRNGLPAPWTEWRVVSGFLS